MIWPDRGWRYGALVALATGVVLGPPSVHQGREEPPLPLVEEIWPMPIEPRPVAVETIRRFADPALFGLRAREEIAEETSVGAAPEIAETSEVPSTAVAGVGWRLRGVVFSDGMAHAVFDASSQGVSDWIYLAEGAEHGAVRVVSITADRVRVTSGDQEQTLRMFTFDAPVD